MIKPIEYLLNGLIWCIHDIGRSIKDNPLTRAWKKIEWPHEFNNGLSCKAIICGKEADAHDYPLGQLLVESAKNQARFESRLKPELTGFKEHVRREAQIIRSLAPITIMPYIASTFSHRSLRGQLLGLENQMQFDNNMLQNQQNYNQLANKPGISQQSANNQWYRLFGGGLGGLF